MTHIKKINKIIKRQIFILLPSEIYFQSNDVQVLCTCKPIIQVGTVNQSHILDFNSAFNTIKYMRIYIISNIHAKIQQQKNYIN